jgi:hypothetical protein
MVRELRQTESNYHTHLRQFGGRRSVISFLWMRAYVLRSINPNRRAALVASGEITPAADSLADMCFACERDRHETIGIDGNDRNKTGNATS